MSNSIQLAKKSLIGLSVGDCVGEQCVKYQNDMLNMKWPKSPWPWTDDTAMASCIVKELEENGTINQDSLALRFAKQWQSNPLKGYGGGTRKLLMAIAVGGAKWQDVVTIQFPRGSCGNGSAMRIAPLGAYFEKIEDVIIEAKKSAEITHSHPEGIIGGMSIALGAFFMKTELSGNAFLQSIVNELPDSEVRTLIVESLKIEKEDVEKAIAILGTGCEVRCQDTVPYCLWVAAHQKSYEAILLGATPQGDKDTCAAIIGGMLGLRYTPPQEWLERVEPLP